MNRALSSSLFLAVAACAAKPAPQPPKAQCSPPVDHAAAATPAPADPTPLSSSSYWADDAAAYAAYERQDWAACAAAFDRAAVAAPWRNGIADLVGAASCLAHTGDLDGAIARLDGAISAGWREVGSITDDPDLALLRGHARWKAVADGVRANRARWEATVNAELLAIETADQDDRKPGLKGIDWNVVGPRDLARETRVRELIAAGALKVADDYFHAALVLQHGRDVEDYALARDLSEKAVALDPNHSHARWLAAAAEDRRLMNLDQPQKYATQFRKENGRMVLYKVDPAITDEDRAQHNCPTLAAAQRRAEALNK